MTLFQFHVSKAPLKSYTITEHGMTALHFVHSKRVHFSEKHIGCWHAILCNRLLPLQWSVLQGQK